MFSTFRVFGGRKIIVNGKYFSFDRKFFFNFLKMVYNFQNCKQNNKPFSNFEHLIFKLTDPTMTRLGPHQDLTGTPSGLTWDSTRPAWDLTETRLRPAWDLLEAA
jgi:hypothetical protein